MNVLKRERERIAEEKERIALRIAEEAQNDARRRDCLEAVKVGLQTRQNEIVKKYKGKQFDHKTRPDKIDFREVNTGEIRVDSSGFVPVSEQIRMFTSGGRTLDNIREQRSTQQYADENRDMFRDETLKQYPTILEAMDKMRELKARGQEQKNENDRLLKEYKRAKKIQDEEKANASKNRETTTKLDKTTNNSHVQSGTTKNNTLDNE